MEKPLWEDFEVTGRGAGHQPIATLQKGGMLFFNGVAVERYIREATFAKLSYASNVGWIRITLINEPSTSTVRIRKNKKDGTAIISFRGFVKQFNLDLQKALRFEIEEFKEENGRFLVLKP